MNIPDYAMDMIELDGFVFENASYDADDVYRVFSRPILSMAPPCVRCGGEGTIFSIPDNRARTFKDIPYQGIHRSVVIDSQVIVCEKCPKNVNKDRYFTPDIPFVYPRTLMTRRLVDIIYKMSEGARIPGIDHRCKHDFFYRVGISPATGYRVINRIRSEGAPIWPK